VAEAFLGGHGLNKRKGTCRSRDELLDELADVIITAAVAMGGITGDVDEAGFRPDPEDRERPGTGHALSSTISAARDDGDALGEAKMLYRLGAAVMDAGQLDEAGGCMGLPIRLSGPRLRPPRGTVKVLTACRVVGRGTRHARSPVGYCNGSH
jgi:hypothetical protein